MLGADMDTVSGANPVQRKTYSTASAVTMMVTRRYPESDDVCNAQVKDTALLGSLQVTRSAKMKVGFSYFKAIIGADHGGDPFAGLSGKLIAAYQDAV